MAANAPLAQATPGGIVVASLAQARRHKRRFDAVMTLEDPKARNADRLRFTQNPTPPHLILSFEDADCESFGYATMEAHQMETALDFGRRFADASLLVHCFHGVGRSAACALAIIADRAGPGHETASVLELFTIRPQATPNLIAVAHADRTLGRNGALIAALTAHEALDPSFAVRRERRMRFAAENRSLYAMRAS
jgi:predicted protein tyrosine phosphatase